MAQPARYLERIERALACIEQAREPDWPGVADLARAAAMSEFHFHRIYRLVTGETPQQTLSRARMGASLPTLAVGIGEAAHASGYSSTQSYARALKALSGATPSQLRADPARMAALSAAIMRPVAATTGAAPLEIAIVELDPLRLVALRRTGDFERLDEGYRALFAELMTTMTPEDITGLYGIPHDDPRFVPAKNCRFDCAVTTLATHSHRNGLATIDTVGGSWLRLRMSGNYDGIHAALDHLYRLVLEFDLALADDLPLNHYHHDPDEVPEDELVTDIHLRLRPASCD